MEIQSFLNNIVTEYPNILNKDLPDFAGCASEHNKEHAMEAFKKHVLVDTKIDYVEVVEEQHDRSSCVWAVAYSMEDDGQLPGGLNGMDNFVGQVSRFHPIDVKLAAFDFSSCYQLICYYYVVCECFRVPFMGQYLYLSDTLTAVMDQPIYGDQVFPTTFFTFQPHAHPGPPPHAYPAPAPPPRAAYQAPPPPEQQQDAPHEE